MTQICLACKKEIEGDFQSSIQPMFNYSNEQHNTEGGQTSKRVSVKYSCFFSLFCEKEKVEKYLKVGEKDFLFKFASRFCSF